MKNEKLKFSVARWIPHLSGGLVHDTAVRACPSGLLCPSSLNPHRKG